MGRANSEAGCSKSSDWEIASLHSLLFSCQTHKGWETPGIMTMMVITKMVMMMARSSTRVPQKVTGPTLSSSRWFSWLSNISPPSKSNNKHQIILGERLLVQPKGGDHRSDHRHRHPPLHPCSALCQEKRGESWTSSQPWASILITILPWTSTPRSNCSGDRLFGRKEKKERGTWVLRLPGRDGKLQLKNISLDSTCTLWST